jgi:hypothetical protein
MFVLTKEQRHELSEAEPVAIDPMTPEQYVLVHKSVYEKMKRLLEDEARTMYPLLADLDPEDWEDRSIFKNS